MRTTRKTIAVMALWICGAASAEECPGGTPSSDGCKRELATVEKMLASAQMKQEARLKSKFGSAAYGGSEGDGYLKEAVNAFRASNRAWKDWRDKECWFLALNDGMSLSPDYASPVAESCKISRTRERIEWTAK